MFSKIKNILVSMYGLIAVLFIWVIMYYLRIYDPLVIPSPIETFKVLFYFFTQTNFNLSFAATLLRILIAFIISSVLGVLFGLAVGYFPFLDKSTSLLIDFLRSIPGIAVFPLFILFFGVSDTSRLLVAIFIALPIILISAKSGVANSKKIRTDLAKLYKLSRYKMFYKIILPEASPYIFSGLKVAISLIIVIVIVTEMLLGSEYGLGRLLINSQYNFETTQLYALIILLGIFGFVINYIFNKIEKRVFHWKTF